MVFLSVSGEDAEESKVHGRGVLEDLQRARCGRARCLAWWRHQQGYSPVRAERAPAAPNGLDEEGATGSSPRAAPPHRQRLGLAGLVVLIFYNVSGGPFGSEQAVRAAGPFWALLGFTLMPVLWSMPQALLTAELATAFPDDGGYVRPVALRRASCARGNAGYARRGTKVRLRGERVATKAQVRRACSGSKVRTQGNEGTTSSSSRLRTVPIR